MIFDKWSVTHTIITCNDYGHCDQGTLWKLMIYFLHPLTSNLSSFKEKVKTSLEWNIFAVDKILVVCLMLPPNTSEPFYTVAFFARRVNSLQMSAQTHWKLASCYRCLIMFGDNISFWIRTRGQSRPQTKQTTPKKSITELCINQFCVEQHAHYVTARCAVVICTEMDSDCHKQKPQEETWHPSQSEYAVWDARLNVSTFPLQEKTKKRKYSQKRNL